MYPIVYLKGEYLNADEAKLHISDLAILRGYGVFDYFRYVKHEPRFIEDHLDRFQRSAAALNMTLPVNRAELKNIVLSLIEKNEYPDGGIRLILTGGYSPDGYTPSHPNLIGMAYPFVPPPARLYEEGCKVLLHNYERQLPAAKSIDYLEGIRILPLLKERGADYVLYVDNEGYVRESDRSNFMMVKDGQLITPKEEVLLGITRKHVLMLAREIGIPTSERPVSKEELLAADELLIVSSVKGILPAVRIDDQPVATGQVGQMAALLMDRWAVKHAT